jgi:uracil-DNA glycosylase
MVMVQLEGAPMTNDDSPAGDSAASDPRAELGWLAGALRRHAQRLERMGVYAARSSLEIVDDAADLGAAAEREPMGEAEDGRSGASLAVVREDLGECTRCKLSSTRTHIVFGVGSPIAPLLFIGEAPGAEEDRRGEPFVGAAGQLLDRMIAAMGWSRDTVYIANVLKCRPPGNRDPETDEVAACLPFLHRQIEVLAPRMIVTLGRPAAQAVLQTDAPISALRGRFREFRGIPVMPTFHPAFLLRSPERKRDAWSDLKQVIDELERLGVRSPHAPRV